MGIIGKCFCVIDGIITYLVPLFSQFTLHRPVFTPLDTTLLVISTGLT